MSSHETLVLRDAAYLLHMAPDSLRKKAKARLIPGSKIGKRWLFSRPVLMEWIGERCRSGLKENTQNSRAIPGDIA